MSKKKQDFYDRQLEAAGTLLDTTDRLVAAFKAGNLPYDDKAFLKILKNLLVEADNLIPELWYSFDELEAYADVRADTLRGVIYRLEDNVKAISDFSKKLKAKK